MASERRWVIVGSRGLYVGQWFTRADAIAEHVSQKLSGLWDDDLRWPEIPQWPVSGKLTADQRRGWRHLRSRGDRCVKATISWEEAGQ